MSSEPGSGPPWRVLVWPGGTEIGLEIRRSLRDHKEVQLVGGGSEHDLHGPLAYRTWVYLPDVGDARWLSMLRTVIVDHAIDVVFPAHDDVLTALSSARDEIPATVIAPPASTCETARSKRATYAALRGAVPVPHIFESPEDVHHFPVFVKPDRGQGSRGAALVRDARALAVAQEAGADLIMEYLPGLEYTVDCFTSRREGLLFAQGRSRGAIRAGISGRSRRAADQGPFTSLARAISERIQLDGPWFFQVREDKNGVLTLLEIGPRVAGTMALHRASGVNFALLALYNAGNFPLAIMDQNFQVEIDRPLANRFASQLQYSTVYCDLDDTLIVNDQVNPRLVALLYQCVSDGCRLVLLTRHQQDIRDTLRRYRLGQLFDEVRFIARHEEKADYIDDPSGILIDDSFRERRIAHHRRGIATFDASSLDVLRKDLA